MLTILNDPAGISGRTTHAIDYGISLQANIERHMEGGAGCELQINGVLVDPLTDPRMERPPSALDLVTITRRPEGIETMVLAAIAIASAVIAYAMIPTPPDVATQNESPNNKLTGQSNIARTYQAIPDVYGYRRIWPDLIQPSTVEYIDNIKYVTEWLCLSRGKGTLTQVQYADTPIGDIAGSSYEVFEPVPVDGYPELGATTINDVFESFASDEVNGQEIGDKPIDSEGRLVAVADATTFTARFVDNGQFARMKALAPSGVVRLDFTYQFGGDSYILGLDATVLSYSVSSGNVTFTFSSSHVWMWNVTDNDVEFEISPIGEALSIVGPFTLPIACNRLWWNINFPRGLNGESVSRPSGGASTRAARRLQAHARATPTPTPTRRWISSISRRRSRPPVGRGSTASSSRACRAPTRARATIRCSSSSPNWKRSMRCAIRRRRCCPE